MNDFRRGRLLAALGAAALLVACDNTPNVPSNYEVIGRTETELGTVLTIRDTGTGCEMTMTLEGIIERNERSVDGTTVKQRCVITGDETPVGAAANQAAAPTAQTGRADAGQPSFSAPNPVGSAAQEQAVRDAIREAAGAGIPPASDAAPAIPPPSGRQSSQQSGAPADDGDDVEAQLKKR